MPNLFFIKDIKKSNSSCTNFDGKKKYIATADLQNGKIVNYEVVDFNSKPSRANLIAVNGSVIFAKMQNTIKVLEIDDSNVDNIYSTGFYSFKDERILPSYMKFFFESNLFNTIKDKNCHGATMKAINDEEMSKISINVPSIQIQQKIIDELSKITELINFNKNNLVNLDKVVKSQFIELFGTPLLNEKGWEVKSTGDVCSVTDGSHFSPVGKEEGYPMLSVRNMRNDGFHYDDCKLVSQEDYDILVKQGCKPLKNDVLIAKDGSYFYYGFVVKEEIEQAVLSSIAILRPNLEEINPEYLCRYMLSSEIVDLVGKNYVTGAAIKRVILKGIKQIPVMLPPMELQNQFVTFVQQIDKSKFIVQKQIKLLEELLEKKMNEYFGN